MLKKNIALIGVGRWGKNHLKTLASMSEVENIFIVDSNENFDLKILDSYKNVKFFRSLNSLFENENNIDGSIIATPPHTHFNIAKQCILNDIHVLIEKPVVETTSELDDLFKLANKRNKLIMAGHILLYHPAIQKIKKLIDKDIIGDIKFIHCQRLNFGVVRNDVDVFLSLAPHDISLIQYFLNEQKYLKIKKLESSFSLSQKNDYSSTLIEYPKKINAQIDVGWFYPEKIQSLKIIGSKKTIVFDDILKTIKVVEIKIDKDLNHINNGEEFINFDMNELPLTSELKSFISYFDNPEKCISGYNHTKNVIDIFENYYTKSK